MIPVGAARVSRNSQLAGGIPDSVVENFEGGDLSSWTAQDGTVWEVTQQNVVEGTYALGTTGVDASSLSSLYSLPGDGLNYYPTKGDVISSLTRDTSSNANIPSIEWGCSLSNNEVVGYQAYIWPIDNSVVLRRFDESGATELDSANPTLSADTWYDWNIEWHDGTGSQPDNEIVATLYEVDTSADLTSELGRSSEVVTLSANDGTYASNSGVSVRHSSSNTEQSPVIDRIWKVGEVE